MHQESQKSHYSYSIYNSTAVVGSPCYSRLGWVPLQGTNALFLYVQCMGEEPDIQSIISHMYTLKEVSRITSNSK